MAVNAVPVLTLTVLSASALVAERFITQLGGVPAAGAACFGVARTSAAATGEAVPVDVLGTAIAESGAAIAAGAEVQVDNLGRVITLAAGVKVGRLAPGSVASAAGQRLEVLLIPN